MEPALNIIESLSFLLQNNPDLKIQEIVEDADNLSACEIVNFKSLNSADKDCKVIDLSNSNLYYLPEKLFEFEKTEILKLSRNNLLNFTGIERLENLKYLYLDENSLKLFPHEIFELKKLIFLNARNNQLHYFSKKMEKLDSLLYLNLENNLISYIPEQTKNFKSLRYLNLSNNRLSVLSKSLLISSELSELHLDTNNIKHVEQSIIDKTKIKILNFNNNPVLKNGKIKHNKYVPEIKVSEKYVAVTKDEDKNVYENVKGKLKTWKRGFQDYIDMFSVYLQQQIGRKIEIKVEDDEDGLKLYTHSDENIPFDTIQNHMQDYLSNIKNSDEQTKELLDHNELMRYELFELKQTVREINSEKEHLEDKVERYYEKVLLLKGTIKQQNEFIDSLKDQVKYLSNNPQNCLNKESEKQPVIVNIDNKQINNNNSGQTRKEEFDPETLLIDLYKKSIRLAERKYTKKIENLHNDDLTDYLRDNGYNVSDQTRSGHSEKEAGILDIMIRDNDGTPLSIIEALKLKSCGKNNKTIADHVYRLIKSYDTVGHSSAFCVVYAEAKSFSGLWKNYRKYLEDINDNLIYKKANCPLISFKETSISDKTDIKIGVSKHLREGEIVKLYHLFINMYVAETITKKIEKVYS